MEEKEPQVGVTASRQDKINEEKRVDPGKEESKIILLPDTSWLVAILDEKDSHHVAAQSSLGALMPYKPAFHVPILASIETMSRLIRVNKMSVSICRKKVLDLFANTLHAKGASRTYKFEEILDRYDKWKRKEVKNLTAVDFCIVTEGIGLEAKILTCDLKMYKSAKKYYQDIYFMSDMVEAQESDLARLIHDIQKLK